ncbi:MAG TPA: hypothetical protein VFP44_04550 [Usitatibacter sp.]|nr:hypothetical protein [Usitatibacter sp.]
MKLAVFAFGAVALSAIVLQPVHATSFTDAFSPYGVTHGCFRPEGAPATLPFGGNTWRAQTFMVRTSGKLVGVLLPVSCTGGNLLVAITDLNGGAPGQNVLTWTYLAASKVAGTPRVYTLLGLPAVDVTAGATLALVLANPQAANGACTLAVAADPQCLNPCSDLNPYPDGSMYWYDGTQSGWVRTAPNGNGVDDMGFQVVVDN